MTGKIEIDVINSSIKVYDTTDWAAQGVNTGLGHSVNVFLKVYVDSANGTKVLYDNLTGSTADIVYDTNDYKEVTTSIPTGPDGELLQGDWVVEMRAEIQTDVRTDEDIIFSYSLGYEWPKACVNATVDCARSTVQSTDTTDYGPYATTITRAHTLTPPPASKQSPKTTSLKTNIYSPIYTKTWTAEVISTVTFTFSDTFIVIKSVAGVNEFEVVCTNDLCKIMCCIRKRLAEYKKLLNTVGLAKAKAYMSDVLNPMIGYMTEYILEERCGNQTKAALAIQNIKDVSGCGDCDSCGGDEPMLVTPTMSIGKTITIDSPDLSIDVTWDESDSEINYHIEVSEAIMEILNNIKAITVDTNTTGYLSVSPVTNPNGSITWFVDLKDAAINDAIEIRYTLVTPPITPEPGDPFMGGVESHIWITGGVVQPMAVAPTYLVGENVPNQSTDKAIIVVTDFIHADQDQATPFTARANVMRMSDTYVGGYANAKDIEAEVFWFSLTAPAFIVRLYNPIDGTPLTLEDLADKGANIYVAIQICIKKP